MRIIQVEVDLHQGQCLGGKLAYLQQSSAKIWQGEEKRYKSGTSSRTVN